MINFKDPKDSVPSFLAIVGIVGLTVSVVLLATSGVVNKKYLVRKKNREIAELKVRESKAKENLQVAEVQIAANKWDKTTEEATPEALDLLTKLAIANKVTVVSFRPQKSTESIALLQQPFVMNIDGPYMNVASFVEAIEKSSGRLAVNQIQLASSEGESDVVNASITVVGFFDKTVTKEETKSVVKQEVPKRG